MKVFSFFSGSGFLDLGFETAGIKIVFVNEFNRNFMDAYCHSRKVLNLPKPVYGHYCCSADEFLSDSMMQRLIRGYVSDARLGGSLVGFIGGPPCPDFSVAGKNRGKDGDRGRLALSYINLIIQNRPDFFLFENVKGLWSTKKHREYYEELKTMLRSAGYSISDNLANALEYGVAQDRQRIILFGVRNDKIPAGSICYDGIITDFPWNVSKAHRMDEIKSSPCPDTNPFSENGVLEMPAGILEDLTVQHWFDKNDVESHPNARHYFTPRAGLAKMQSYAEGDVSKKCYKRLHRWRYSPTAAYGNNEVHLHPYHARRLSVAEALAIQSLPKEFELPPDMSLTDMFKTIGNGVPYLFARAIADAIKVYFGQE